MRKSKQNCNQMCCKLLKYRIMFKDKLTFLGLYYKDDSLIPCCNRNQFKNDNGAVARSAFKLLRLFCHYHKREY